MSSVGHFPVQFTDIDKCPDQFRDPLKRAINATENIYDIIYSPAYLSGRSSLPGSVFCVTNRQWLIAHDPKRKGDGVALESAVYADTLLAELTDILLYGRLKIEYAFNDQSKSSVCYFNTVFEDMYTNAIQRVLNLIDDVPDPAVKKDRKIFTYLKGWPHKFRNLGWDYLPPGISLLDALHWPTILGGFRRELGPAVALFLTDRHLVILADERSRSWFVKKGHIKVGVIVTYFPRSRISGFQIQKHNRFHVLELEASGAHSAACFQVRFPPEYQEKVVQLVSKAAPSFGEK
jgi:hypothetical protein